MPPAVLALQHISLMPELRRQLCNPRHLATFDARSLVAQQLVGKGRSARTCARLQSAAEGLQVALFSELDTLLMSDML